MSNDVAVAQSPEDVDQQRLDELFLDVILDDPEFLETEFAAIVRGLDPGSGTHDAAGRSGRPAESAPGPDDEVDARFAVGASRPGCGTSARPPPHSR